MRVSDYSANIRRAYERSTDAHRTTGERWYRRMATITQGHAARLGISPESVGGVYAAHSINTPWGHNLRIVARALRGKVPYRGTLTDNIRKAEHCLAGHTIGTAVKDSDNHKIVNFARACSGDYSAVVVDRWAYSVATGWRECPNRGVKACAKNGRHACGKVPKGREYLDIARAYVNVALRHDLQPAMLQAIVWVAARGK